MKVQRDMPSSMVTARILHSPSSVAGLVDAPPLLVDVKILDASIPTTPDILASFFLSTQLIEILAPLEWIKEYCTRGLSVSQKISLSVLSVHVCGGNE